MAAVAAAKFIEAWFSIEEPNEMSCEQTNERVQDVSLTRDIFHEGVSAKASILHKTGAKCHRVNTVSK